MPQPVHYSHQIDFDFVPESLLERSKLAAHLTVISALWNDIEARLGTFLAALAGSEAPAVISMFHAITNDGAKRAAIEAVTSLKLSQAERQAFQVAMRTVSDRYADRNRIVHGAWGVSPLYPDQLLWADIREMTMLLVDLMGMDNKQQRDARFIATQKKIMVYSEEDFVQIRNRMHNAYDILRDFTRPFMDRSFAVFAKVDLPPHSTRVRPTDGS